MDRKIAKGLRPGGISLHAFMDRPDIEEKAKEMGYNLTANNCDNILDHMEIHIDSGLGVSGLC